jgi:hypothetical protein
MMWFALIISVSFALRSFTSYLFSKIKVKIKPGKKRTWLVAHSHRQTVYLCKKSTLNGQDV